MTASRIKSPTKASAKPHASEDTHDRLIAAATVLFAQRGYDGVSVKELADAAEANVSLVSYHFGGKENLYRACLERFGKERLAIAERVLQPPQTFEELRIRLKMFFEEMLAAHLDNRDTAQMIHRECEKELPLAPDIFRNTFLKVFETMVAFFRSGQESGIIRKELDPLVVSQLVFGGMIHIIRSEKIAQKYFGLTLANEGYRHQLIDHILQCNLFGIATEDARQAHSGSISRSPHHERSNS